MTGQMNPRLPGGGGRMRELGTVVGQLEACSLQGIVWVASLLVLHGRSVPLEPSRNLVLRLRPLVR